MLLILLLVTCLQGQPGQEASPADCQITSMMPFDLSDQGVRAACHELFVKEASNRKRALMIVYANGLNVKISDASGACMSIPENQIPTRKAFLENVWKGKEATK